MLSWKILCMLGLLIACVNSQIAFGDEEDEKVQVEPAKEVISLRQGLLAGYLGSSLLFFFK